MKQSQSSNKLVQIVKKFKHEHPDVYEFILFNIMSNVATITNFLVLWLISMNYTAKRFLKKKAMANVS